MHLLQAARGVQVKAKVFLGSPHCEHYRIHTAAYRDELIAFMEGIQSS
jgi:hypothetical protein